MSLRSGARVQDALSVSATRRSRSTSGPTSSPSSPPTGPTSPSSPCTARDGEDGTVQELLEVLGIPYTGSGVSACIRAVGQGAGQARDARRAGSRRPTSTPSTRPPSARWAPPRRCRRSRTRLEFPIVVKPARQGSALGIKFARTPPTSRRRWSPPSPMTARCCSSATSRAASWRSRSSTRTARRWCCRSSRRSPRRRTSTTSRPATRSAAPALSARPSSTTRSRRGRARSRWRPTGCSAARASPAST